MKTIPVILSALFLWTLFPCLSNGQTTTENYILTRTSTDGGTSNYIQRIDYFDGLGRPVEQVRCRVGTGGQDLVSLTEYDSYGRKMKEWLPAAVTGNNGNYIVPSMLRSKITETQANDASPYSEWVYETSPLDRVKEEYAPGDSWRSGHVETSYLTNNSSYPCVKFVSTDVGTSVGVTRSGNYASGELYVTRTKDAAGNISYEFKDKTGRTVLTRQMDGAVNFDTYYVYDNYSNLRVVLPPLASDALSSNGTFTESNTALQNYAYLYQYDDRSRCIAKKLPGAEWIYLIYDKADRLIFTQDGVQRSQGRWSFTIPDAFDRTVLKGTCTNSLSYSSNPLGGTLVSASWTSNGSYKGYAVSGVSLAGHVLEDVFYYDNYDFIGKNGYPSDFTFENRSGYAASKLETPQGLLTGKIDSESGNAGNLYYTVYYYDRRSRLIQTQRTNHLSGTDKEFVAYAFDGQPEKRYHVQTVAGAVYNEEYAYTYDYYRRPVNMSHRWNGGPAVLLEERWYDSQGRLDGMRHNTDSYTNTFLFSYDIRGRLTKRGDSQFTEEIGYTAGDNIAWLNWQTGGVYRKSEFSYDGLSRLTTAAYTNGPGDYKSSYAYDKHGNPVAIRRYGKTTSSAYGLIDNLSLTYNGNRVTSVTDAAAYIPYSFSHDFKDFSNQSTEYSYDANGNMTKDLNRGISSVTYNSLNLPVRIEIKSPVGESRNDYVYRSDGTKMRVVHKWNPAYSTAPVIGSSVSESALTESETTDYVGNFVYRNGSLKQVLTETGYIENGLYYDYIKDHLGSNRLVVHDSPSSQAINYYPFGLPQSDEKAPEIQDYKFIGKEYDSKQGLRLYDFEARMYDPQLGRFLTMDALSEKYYAWSPYNYAFCNPTRFIDPTGMSPEDDEWEKRLRYRSLLDRLAAGLRSLFTIEIDTRTSESLSASAARHEEKIQTLGNAVETVNTATDALSAVMPFGSTILSVAKAASGEDVNAGDVGFAAMEIAPLGAVGKVAKGGNTVIKGFTRHAMEQAITRGFKTVDILRIVREGTSIQAAGRYGSQIRYTLGSNVVVVNAYGKVVTVFSDFSGSSKGINKGFFIPFK